MAAQDQERQEQFIQWLDTNEAIHNEVGKHRGGARPGSSDAYRELNFAVDRSTGEWALQGKM